MEIFIKGSNAYSSVLDPNTTKRKNPDSRKILPRWWLYNFEYLANSLDTIIIGMSREKSWELAVEVDSVGSARVLRATLE